MARERGTQANYTGSSGQMAVMAELLARHCNAAVPVVDVGTDVFAFLDEREDVTRIQVKTGRGKRYKGEAGYGVRFDIPLKQLRRQDLPPLHYALAVRLDEVWGDFLILTRPQLRAFANGPRKFRHREQRGREPGAQGAVPATSGDVRGG